MRIRLTKNAKNASVTLTCMREDGTCTWQPSSRYFARHDLIHYVVESTLGYTQAFWGRVAQGKDLDAFGTKKGVQDTYTLEERWAESIVGLLQWPAVSGGPALDDEELLAMLNKTCADNGCAIPSVTSEQLVKIRNSVRVLHRQWEELPVGQTLELTL